MKEQQSTTNQRRVAWRTTELIPNLTAEALARATGRSIDAARSGAKRHGLPLAPKRRGYSDSIRNRALRLRQSGKTVPEIARATGVAPRTIQNWEAKARAEGNR